MRDEEIDQVRAIVAEPTSKFRGSVMSSLAKAGMDVVAISSSDNLIQACTSRATSVVLLVIDLPPDGGLSTIESLQVSAPGVPIIIWGDYLNGETALAVIRAGARGVMERNISNQALVRSVTQVVNGEISVPRSLATHVISEFRIGERRNREKFELAGLSPREQQVVALVGEGYSNREIAQRLNISELTAKRHVHNLLAKLGVPTRAAAARLFGSAYHQGEKKGLDL